MKMVFIDPYYNHTAGSFADKWLAPRLGTDVALGLAIAYVWLTEGTYDKEYVADQHRWASTSGRTTCWARETGRPRPPEWAEQRIRHPGPRDPGPCPGVGHEEDHAGRRRQAVGGACRSATGNEWARTMIALAAMQGMGKAGQQHLVAPHRARRVDTDLLVPRLRRGRHLRRRRQLGSGFRLAHRMFPTAAMRHR